MLSSDCFKVGLAQLSARYGVIKDQGQFFAYCQKAFQGPAEFERACELVAITCQDFPEFSIFGKLLEQDRRPAPSVPEPIAVPTETSSMDRSKWTPLTAEEIAGARWGTKHQVIERLKAKVHVCQFFNSKAALPHGSRFMREAIEEATARGIPLDLIGLTERAIA